MMKQAATSVRTAPSRPRRRGLSLIEVVVALAIALFIGAVLLPSVYTAAGFRDEAEVRRLSSTLGYLRQQAVLSNRTFRVGFDLQSGEYTVEAGDPKVLIFDDPKRREDWLREEERRRRSLADPETPAEQAGEFEAVVVDDFVELTGSLPESMVFRGVYTPQYGELVRLNSKKKDAPTKVYIHFFPNGFAEHAVIQVVDAEDEREGYTLEVEALSGRVRLFSEVIDPEKLGGDVPESGPDLP